MHKCIIASFLDLIRCRGPSYGLYLNIFKTEVFWPSGDSSVPELPPSIQQMDLIESGAEVLGFPMCGSEMFFGSCFSKRIEKIWECQECLQDLENPQVELQLLRSCLPV